MSVAVFALVMNGSSLIEKVLSLWSFVLYGVYILFLILVFANFSGQIGHNIGILPGIILFIAMCGFYPTIIEQELPVDYILTQMNMPWLRYIFQIVLFGTLIETGSGLIYSITDRIAEAFKNKGQEVPKWSTPVVAVILLVGTTAISSFGLTGLIAKGYGTLAWVMFIVYVIPILTLGIYKISKAKKN